MALPGSVWVEAESAAMEKNGDAVVLEVSKAPGVGLHDLDLGVEALGGRVRDAMATVGEEPGQVAL